MKNKHGKNQPFPSRPYPNDYEAFELTLEGETPDNQPLAMALSYVNHNYRRYQKEWKHDGPVVHRTQISTFMLVEEIPSKPCNWHDFTKKLLLHGQIPEGQWLQAFKKAFPNSDGKRIIGVADNSWNAPSYDPNKTWIRYPHFPYIRRDGLCRFLNHGEFLWMSKSSHRRWRWLVEAGN